MYSLPSETKHNYLNYYNYVLQLFEQGNCFDAEVIYTPIGVVAKNISFSFKKCGKEFLFSDFSNIEKTYDYTVSQTSAILSVHLSDGPDALPSAKIVLKLEKSGLTIAIDDEKPDYVLCISGSVAFGCIKDLSSVSLNKEDTILRSSLGPAVSSFDNAIFNRKNDCALRFSSSEKFAISFDFEKDQYRFTANSNIQLWVEENVIANRFATNYSPINKNSTFSPPAGWMTWYAVKFDACEQAVLENAQKLKELFSNYGANTVWVDWEWCHSALFDKEPNPEIDFFHPDKGRYPNGLDYVADKISENGLIPALWIAPTIETSITDFMEKHEGVVLADFDTWCARYFYDITHPAYINEFIPKAFNQVKEWGYKAVKWDCLPITLYVLDLFHNHLTNSSLTSEQALKNVIKKGRETLGDEYYMMSCSGEWDREVLFAADVFDAGRIGGDIFSWDDFEKNFIKRILRFYPCHNNMFYCDPDNLVVRPEFNDLNQAITRASLISLMGLPITMGDDLRELPMERVDIIRRALPPLDIRPSDLEQKQFDGRSLITNLAVAKSFECWNVVGITNFSDTAADMTVNFQAELGLLPGEYLVFDYWNHKFLGRLDGSLTLNVPAFGTTVLSIHKCSGKKQIISTSRHISQGAFDLIDVKYGENGEVRGRSLVIEGEEYIITCYDPQKDCVTEKVINPTETGELNWVL